MRLIILSYVGNEEDIIEAFVRHHAAVAERIVLVTTGTDKTGHLLQLLAKEGLPLDIRPHQPAYHDQHEVLSALLQEKVKSADWFLPLDADEFLQGDVQTALNAFPSDHAMLLPWRTYIPLPEDNKAELNIVQRITHRRTTERPQFRKVLIPANTVTDTAWIAQGNHALGNKTGIENDLLTIAHFPVRTSAQLLRKISSGWHAVQRNPAREENEARHWRAMYEKFSSRQMLSASELQNIALRYAMAPDDDLPSYIQDPVPHTFKLRYTA